MAGRGPARVLTFGDGGEVRAERVELDADLLPRFRLETPWGGRADVRLPVRGRHQVANALAAAAAALALDVPLDDVVAGLAAATPSPWRMELHTAGNGCIVLNDAYNANPASMEAALRSFVEVPARAHVALLGEMAELGPTAPAEHEAVASLARSLEVEVLAYRTEAYGVETVLWDLPQVEDRLGGLHDGDALLVKGSRIAQLDAVATHLLTQVLR
jgi:UDP-N-acetylmuramoyl-tripeptide--D-alanyl-D-alanine ligase